MLLLFPKLATTNEPLCCLYDLLDMQWPCDKVAAVWMLRTIGRLKKEMRGSGSNLTGGPAVKSWFCL